MAKSWTDIATTEIDSESPVTEGLVAKFHDNQEALITSQIDTRFAEATGVAASFNLEAAVDVFVPPQVGTTAGDVTLVVRLQVKVDSGTTGKVRIKLSGGSAVDSGTISSTSYVAVELVISSTDVKAAKDTVETLEIYLQRDTGAGDVYAKCEIGASRLERAA